MLINGTSQKIRNPSSCPEDSLKKKVSSVVSLKLFNNSTVIEFSVVKTYSSKFVYAWSNKIRFSQLKCKCVLDFYYSLNPRVSLSRVSFGMVQDLILLDHA